MSRKGGGHRQRLHRVSLQPLRVLTVRLTAAVLMVMVVGTAAAEQPQVPRQAFLEQRVKDLLDYRLYLEDQLAAAKALLAVKDQALATAEANLKACHDRPASQPKDQ